MTSRRATWRNPKHKRPKHGFWEWYWPGQYFIICIDGKVPFKCYNETPDFDGWVREI